MSLPKRAVRVLAPAKLNLYLHALGKRPDGFHELDSLVVFCGVGDVLTVQAAADYSLAIDGPFGPELAAEDPEKNLVTKAVRTLADAMGRAPGLAVRLTKNLPLASGIGGGSADAAAALRAAAVAWGLSPDDPRPAEIAPRLGSDVTVCFAGSTSYFGGLGELIEPGPPMPKLHLVLANPGVITLTREVFAARTGPWGDAGRFERDPQGIDDLVGLLKARRNDLGAAAQIVAPPVREVLAALEGQAGCKLARMSGSGSTCFAIFGTQTEARAAASSLHAAHPTWWAVATETIDAEPPIEIA